MSKLLIKNKLIRYGIAGFLGTLIFQLLLYKGIKFSDFLDPLFLFLVLYQFLIFMPLTIFIIVLCVFIGEKKVDLRSKVKVVVLSLGVSLISGGLFFIGAFVVMFLSIFVS